MPHVHPGYTACDVFQCCSAVRGMRAQSMQPHKNMGPGQHNHVADVHAHEQFTQTLLQTFVSGPGTAACMSLCKALLPTSWMLIPERHSLQPSLASNTIHEGRCRGHEAYDLRRARQAMVAYNQNLLTALSCSHSIGNIPAAPLLHF